MFTNLLSNSLFLALLASLCLSWTVPVVGSLVLVQRKSGLADSLAHVSMLGAALGLWLGQNSYLSAIVVAVIFAFAVFELGHKIPQKEAILALFTGLSLAFISLIKKISGIRINLESIFYGNLNLISWQDLSWIMAISLGFMIIVVRFYKQFLWISIDEDLAQTQGIELQKIRALFNMLAALVFAVFIQVFGIVIISLISIATVLIASQLQKGFKPKLIWSCLVSSFSLIASILISYFWLDYSISSVLAIVLLLTLTLTYFANRIIIWRSPRLQ
jgi:zinc transport system permease protein